MEDAVGVEFEPDTDLFEGSGGKLRFLENGRIDVDEFHTFTPQGRSNGKYEKP